MLNVFQSSNLLSGKRDLDAHGRRNLKKRARAEWHRRLDRIAQTAQSGRQREAVSLVRHFLRSKLCKTAAMYAVNSKLRTFDRKPESMIVRAALRLSLWHPCPETATIILKRKPNGKQRIITNFGFFGRAGQLMCKEALSALHGHLFKDWQFGLARQKGGLPRGRDACAQALAKQIQTGAHSFFAEMDIDDFYGSINPERLTEKEIGLPKEAIKYFICASAYHYRLSKGFLNARLHAACRRGIPQGSIVSPIVSALVVAKVMKVCDVQSIINYADNFAILASSTEGVAMLAQSLQAAFRSSPYGTFSVSKKQNVSLDEGWRFLGYEYLRNEDGEVHLEPRDKSWAHLREKIVETAKDHRMRGDKLATVRTALNNMIGHWKAGYAIATTSRHELDVTWLAEYVTTKVSIKDFTSAQVISRAARYRRNVQRALLTHEPGFMRKCFPRMAGL